MNRWMLWSAFGLVVLSGCDKMKSDGAGASSSAQASATAASVVPKVDEVVKFGKKFPKPGDKADETQTMDMSMKAAISFNGKTQESDMQMHGDEKKHEEVLASEANAITKMKVTYTEKVESMTEGKGKPHSKPSKVSGKTYVLSMQDGKMVVSNDKEKAAPKDEAEVVTHDYSHFGKPEPFIASMPERALKPGETVPELANGLKDSFQETGKNAPTLSDVSLVFKGKDGDKGTFDVQMTLSIDADMKMTIPMKGTLTVRIADSWPLALSMEGPLTVANPTGKDAKMPKGITMTGSGTAKIALTRSFP